MNMLKRVATATVLAVGIAGVVEAHHAANSQFDTTQNLAFSGALEKYYVGAPHGYWYFTRMENGEVKHWVFETGAPDALRRSGLSMHGDLKIGETYKIAYSPALDGSNAGLITGIKLADGRIIGLYAKDNADAADKLLTEKLLNGDK